MAEILNNFHQNFIKNKVKGLTNSEAYLHARQFSSKLKDKQCTPESANIAGCILAKKLRTEINNAIELKCCEIEIRDIKRKEEVKRIFEYDLTSKEGVLMARSTFTSLLVQDYHGADMEKDAPFKASIGKTIADLLKLDAPEKLDLSKINYKQPIEDVLKDVLVALGGNEKSLQVVMKGFEGKIRKEIADSKEASAIIKHLDAMRD